MNLSVIKNFMSSGNERTIKAKKNILASLLLKGCSMMISFMLIPLTLGYLNTYEYGVWLVLSSFMQWIDFFDIGLGNGLRNKLSESLAKNDYEKGRIYVSTTFVSLFIIVLLLYLLFYLINFWIDWYQVLNVSPVIVSNLRTIILIVFGMMCLNFVFKTIIYVYYAKQISMMSNLVTFLTQVISFLAIYILTKTTSGQLWKVALAYSLTPVIILLVSYPVTFFYKFRELSPSLLYFRKGYLRDLIGLGFEFFLLKIGALLIFATSNVIISRTLSPEEVTPYNIALKYFSITTIAYSIITTPMWSAATEAYVKKDFIWLKKSSNSMLKIFLLISSISILMVIFSEPIYRIWVGEKVLIPYNLTILLALYSIFVNLSTCYSTYLFGMGKIRMQIWSTFVPGIIFVFIAPYLASLVGIQGVALALVLVNVPSMILNPIQFNILLSSSKHNKIWYK